MNYQDFDIKISYINVGEKAFCEIINPLLSCTKTYKRSVGFFSSKSFYYLKEGILALARSGGKIEMATSPKLSEEDISAIKSGYDAREILEKRYLNELNEEFNELNDECLVDLYNLVKERIMDIKIVTKKGGMYHDKLAVLTDYSGNKIAFVGSNNESSAGYHDNYEKVRVYRSWIENDRVEDETNEFESIWSNSNEFLEVYDFTEAFRKQILESVERQISLRKKESKGFTGLRDYQIEARDAWLNNNCTGFFEMATGTGKTYTALYSLIELIRKKPVFTIILAPYKHLVNQWYNTIKKSFNDVDVVKVFSEVENPEETVYSLYLQSKKNYRPIIVVSTIVSFFLDRYQLLYDRIDYEKLLVVDEAHNFINKLSDELSSKYVYKLGLSATPIFGKDEEKTELLLNWFGGKVMTFSIEKAIGKYLVNYEYIPIYVNASDEDERKFRVATTQMLSAIDPETGKIIDEEKFTIAYRARLRAISMAEEKTSRIEEIFNRIEETTHTIIYCSDGKLFGVAGTGTDEIKHLDYMLKLINNSLLKKKGSYKASKFTASEDAKTRMELIDLFDKAKINYLVAIKCLDEGIDIPSIKSALILSSNDNYREFVQRRGRILRQDEGKDIAKIYDVVVLPSTDNKSFAEIELRRFYEYARLAIHNEHLMDELDELLNRYGMSREDIQFKNDYVYGGEMDE